MKKLMIGIFAHPDDEAFGPSGTLLKLHDEGYDIHLILLTDGEAGSNLDDSPSLGSTRLTEWQAAANIIGAASTYALHYPDGKLDTIPRREIGEKVQRIIGDIVATYAKPIVYAYMTFEPGGLTGHHDHIVASRLTTKIAEQDEGVTVWYFCLDSTQAPLTGTAYYEPRAREDTYITDRVDVSQYLTLKHQIMDAHVSQRVDVATMKKLCGTTECFHIDQF